MTEYSIKFRGQTQSSKLLKVANSVEEAMIQGKEYVERQLYLYTLYPTLFKEYTSSEVTSVRIIKYWKEDKPVYKELE